MGKYQTTYSQSQKILCSLSTKYSKIKNFQHYKEKLNDFYNQLYKDIEGQDENIILDFALLINWFLNYSLINYRSSTYINKLDDDDIGIVFQECILTLDEIKVFFLNFLLSKQEYEQKVLSLLSDNKKEIYQKLFKQQDPTTLLQGISSLSGLMEISDANILLQTTVTTLESYQNNFSQFVKNFLEVSNNIKLEYFDVCDEIRCEKEKNIENMTANLLLIFNKMILYQCFLYDNALEKNKKKDSIDFDKEFFVRLDPMFEIMNVCCINILEKSIIYRKSV
ncbi:hypothetical protein AB837_00456 [bacterium AB1]|nr:hypothetical protein AB837_00456 [bacterium AB1]